MKSAGAIEGGRARGFLTLCALTSPSLSPPPFSELMGGFLMLFLAPLSWRAVRGRRREREERREVEEEEEERQGDEEEEEEEEGFPCGLQLQHQHKGFCSGILLDRDQEKNGSAMSFFSRQDDSFLWFCTFFGACDEGKESQNYRTG